MPIATASLILVAAGESKELSYTFAERGTRLPAAMSMATTRRA